MEFEVKLSRILFHFSLYNEVKKFDYFKNRIIYLSFIRYSNFYSKIEYS